MINIGKFVRNVKLTTFIYKNANVLIEGPAHRQSSIIWMTNIFTFIEEGDWKLIVATFNCQNKKSALSKTTVPTKWVLFSGVKPAETRLSNLMLKIFISKFVSINFNRYS